MIIEVKAYCDDDCARHAWCPPGCRARTGVRGVQKKVERTTPAEAAAGSRLPQPAREEHAVQCGAADWLTAYSISAGDNMPLCLRVPASSLAQL